MRGSPVESSAIGGSFNCFQRQKFPREGGDRGFLDPSKDSSSGSTCGGVVEVVRRIFGATVEEVQGEVERTRARLARLKEEAASARPVDVTPDLRAELTRLRAELAEAKREAPEERPRVETMPQTTQELWDWTTSSLEVLAMQCSS